MELLERDWDYSRIATFLKNEGYTFEQAIREVCYVLQSKS